MLLFLRLSTVCGWGCACLLAALQEAVNDAPEQAEYNNFFGRNAPRYYALSQGRYWLKDLGSLPSGGASTAATNQGMVVVALPVREGTFRLLMTDDGDNLLLQQRQATGIWHSQLPVELRATADSLLHHYDRHTATSDLPPPVELHAHSDRLQLRLFLTSLNRSQMGHKTSYTYSSEEELQIRQ